MNFKISFWLTFFVHILAGCVWYSQGLCKEWLNKLAAGNTGRLGTYMGAGDVSHVESNASQGCQCLRKELARWKGGELTGSELEVSV